MKIRYHWDTDVFIHKLKELLDLEKKTMNRILIVAKELTTNIVKYGEDGTVTVDDDEGKKIMITVKDHGPGIEDIEHAWEDGFALGRKVVTDEDVMYHKGLGNGLSAVKRISDEIEYETNSKGTEIKASIFIE